MSSKFSKLGKLGALPPGGINDLPIPPGPGVFMNGRPIEGMKMVAAIDGARLEEILSSIDDDISAGGFLLEVARLTSSELKDFRDVMLFSDLPTEFVVDEKYGIRVSELADEKLRLDAMDEEDAAVLEVERVEKYITDQGTKLCELATARAKKNAIRESVEGWSAKGPSLVCIQSRALLYLDEAIQCNLHESEILTMDVQHIASESIENPTVGFNIKRANNLRDLHHATLAMEREESRVAENNRWLNTLRDSLKGVK